MENGLKTENESTEDKNNKKLSSCCTIRPSEAVILTGNHYIYVLYTSERFPIPGRAARFFLSYIDAFFRG